eukprot:CAMPEP_0115275862 /NCGR_PEP_ID=MMETSP0270-20121206/56417_1 /TAXON_ID=71861 /ORGANISM="Scrippsiella trochoidea, Strain CCMP3099" /LENGTH=42 /DNA_ID= /DNA_START= /DNA_END= /DNA_ORIENTATION=
MPSLQPQQGSLYEQDAKHEAARGVLRNRLRASSSSSYSTAAT